MKWTEEETNALFGKGLLMNKIICHFYDNPTFIIPNTIYSIYVLEMPQELIEYITENLETITESYPIPPTSGGTYSIIDDYIKAEWKETPIDEDEYIFYKFIIRKSKQYHVSRSINRIKRLKMSISYFEELMNEKKSYYSYIYSKHGSRGNRFDDIDFYVFKIKKKIMVLASIRDVTY
jgi:hypothetical protein